MLKLCMSAKWHKADIADRVADVHAYVLGSGTLAQKAYCSPLPGHHSCMEEYVLNSDEGAHPKAMSIFEADEHLR